ncbi:hypothetical protein DFP72DRAFT_909106 [Ephemerocybe angulata]|uniref:DUF6533 domain-containing protein n=1 Tax=Ephemerocybe angulata TaxID=980116 RepID=A0A8H6HQU7_9AGAR|nr:hypothetical protein DFP72DRAFT_909106 [Tulosesus angulatus]
MTLSFSCQAASKNGGCRPLVSFPRLGPLLGSSLCGNLAKIHPILLTLIGLRQPWRLPHPRIPLESGRYLHRQMNVEVLYQRYEDQRYVTYVETSGHVLVVVDFIQTFPDEVRLMWPAPSSVPKFLFFLARYYILLHTVFRMIYEQARGLSPEACKITFVLVFVSSSFAVLCAESILFIRVWAFSHRNRKIGIYLTLQFFSIHVPALVLMIQFVKSVKFAPLVFRTWTCIPVYGDYVWLGVCFCLALASVVTIMLIMVSIALKNYRQIKSDLFTLFYRDGILYFLCLSVLASANIAVNFLAPPAYKFLLLEMQVLTHVILSTRMLLHLREWSERDKETGGGTLPSDCDMAPEELRPVSPIRFERPEVASSAESEPLERVVDGVGYELDSVGGINEKKESNSSEGELEEAMVLGEQ